MEASQPKKREKRIRNRQANLLAGPVPTVPTFNELLILDANEQEKELPSAEERTQDAEHSPEAAAAVCSSQNDGEEQSPTTSNLHPTMEEEETTKAEAIVTDLVENVSAVERGEDQAEKAQKKEGDEQAAKCATAGDGIMIETSVDVNGDGASTSAKELTQPPKEPIHQYPLGIGAQNRNSMEPERQRQQIMPMADRTRMSEPPTAPPIYPALSEPLASSQHQSIPTEIKSQPKVAFLVPQISIQEVPASRTYPNLVEVTENSSVLSRARMAAELGEAELLGEQQLLECYQNEQLEFVDDFVDIFCQQELEPRNSLFDLLAAYKGACERIQANEDLKTTKIAETHDVNARVWTINENKITQQGKCGCDRSAYGENSYKVAQMHPELLVQLKEAFDVLTGCELDVGLCQSVRASSLALQIQWNVGELRKRFFIDHQLQSESPSILLSKSPSHGKSARLALRGALSDLFYFLRFPMPPQRFRQSVINWISELAAVLLKACTGDDQFFLLSQVLRTPSPLGQWAAPLVQTFVTTPMLELQRPMDNFVALLAMLMQPVLHRERFLVPVLQYYEGENAWNMIADDGEVDNANLAEISENDLIELLAQFPICPLLSLAFRHFTILHQGVRLQILYSLVSFVSCLLKIYDEGLQTYGTMKNLCKRIADNICKVIHFFCSYWTLVQMDLAAGNSDERQLLQNEVNRILLQAVYYIVSKKNAIIRQFLVDLPYDSVTENCRLRCQLLLRSPPSKNAPTVRSLYDIPDSELLERVKSGPSLVDQLGSERQSDDLTYTVSALASIVSRSEQELLHFVTEIINICFLNENSRADFYKVGSEAMATLIERNLSLLSPVLRYIDRHVDHLDDYAVNILNNVPLHKCTISAEDITDRLGKWLIQRPPNNPASTIARRVLTCLNWSTDGKAQSSVQHLDGEKLGIPLEVHGICAETLVKAHFVQCKQRNSLISKPLNKIARLATKCPDLEQAFDRFCWDVLLKLKITENLNAPPPPNDLTAFFVHCMQKSLSSPTEFMETGVRYFQELVNSACYNAASAILARAVCAFPNRIHLLTGNAIFTDSLERLLHADESNSYASYAIQFITGADKFPGPVLTFISSAIMFQLMDAKSNEQRQQQLVHAWLHLLTCPKPTKWNEDKFVLFLIGTISKCAFVYDAQRMFGCVEIVLNLYKAQCQQWKESGRGPLSWFSSSSYIQPPLIASSLFSTSPWATFLLLCAEQKTIPEFYTQLHDAIGKHQNRTLEESVKRASSRSHTQFSVDRLAYNRWLQFCCDDEIPSSHPVLPLAIQQLALALFSRKQYENHPFCPGWKYFKCKQSEPLFVKLRTKVLPKAEANGQPNEAASNVHGREKRANSGDNGIHPSAAPTQTHALMNAFGQWMAMERCYRPEQLLNYGDLPMDYLLQTIVSGDGHIWTEFVDTNVLRENMQKLARIFSKYCHLNFATHDEFAGSSPSPNSSNNEHRRQRFSQYANLTQFFSALNPENIGNSTNDDARPFPELTIHQNLPLPDPLDMRPKVPTGFAALNPFASSNTAASDIIIRFTAHLDELNAAAKTFLNTKEFVEKNNVEYLELFPQLYKQFERKLTLTLQCGNLLQTSRCAKPAIYEMTVKPFEYQQDVAEKMNSNRQRRGEESAKLLDKADSLAITSARIEYICSNLQKQMALASSTNGIFSEKSAVLKDSKSTEQQQQLLLTGISLFYRICQTAQGCLLLFPAGMDAYAACLRKLGSAFIAKNPAEQMNLMRLVLSENPLNHLLVEHFTPHCVQPPELLAQLYAELSASVRQATTAEAALSLLRRLDIEHAGQQLPTNQFHALMPVMFENLASVTGNTAATAKSPLRELCIYHFVHAMFHHFPHNFTNGLRLALTGCDKQCVPATFFIEIARRLRIEPMLANECSPKGDSSTTPPSKKSACTDTLVDISAEKALECVRVISQQLVASKRELNSRLFAVWSPYLEQVCELADFFLRSYVSSTFRAEASTATMEKELSDAFRHAIECWAPLLEPVPVSNLPPWNASDTALAQKVLDRLLRHLLWLPYTLYIPPDRECPESLFWNYFASRLVGDQLRNCGGSHSSASSSQSAIKHIYSVYENKLTALNWSRFWPTLLDLGTMDQLLFHFPPTFGSPGSSAHHRVKLSNHELQVAPIVAEILVRLPWQNLIHQYLSGYQPAEATRAFHSLLLSIFVKCLHRKENYTRSRASMGEKVKFLHDNCQWAYTKADTVERVGAFLADTFPTDFFGGYLDGAQQSFLGIWRQACHFSTIPVILPAKIPVNELGIARKRAVYVRTQLRLIFRHPSNEADKQEQLRLYAEVLDKANFVLISAEDKVDYLDMARELVEVFVHFYDQEMQKGKDSSSKKCRAMLDQIYGRLVDWLTEHPDSSLVLLLTSVGPVALDKAPPELQNHFGLGIVETGIGVYFKRGIAHQWREISQWVRMPAGLKEQCFTVPRSDSVGESHFLTLNAILMQELAGSGHRLGLLKQLADFLSGIKPKYAVNNEPGFLLCIEKWQRMCIALFSGTTGASLSDAHDYLRGYMLFLQRIYTDEGTRGTGFLSMVTSKFSRRLTHSNRFQLLAHVMHLFIFQQLVSPQQQPRLRPGHAIMNSRLAAFQDLQNQKANTEFSGALAEISPHFTKAPDYCLTDAEFLFQRFVHLLYPGERVLQTFENSTIMKPFTLSQSLF